MGVAGAVGVENGGCGRPRSRVQWARRGSPLSAETVQKKRRAMGRRVWVLGWVWWKIDAVVVVVVSPPLFWAVVAVVQTHPVGR